MDDKLKVEIENLIRNNPNISINELNKEFQVVVNKYNNTGIEHFEGLSPEIMYNLLYSEWGKNIISVNPDNHNGDDIPIIKQLKYFTEIMKESGEIKLTKAGYLPPVIVKKIYNEKIITDRMIEMGITKLTKETDIDNIVVMKIFCELAGLIKKRNNKLSLTKNALKEINTKNIFEKILYVAFKKYNWAYFDYFENEMIGGYGNNYTLYLLNKYGNDWKDSDFYADLYFKAFPKLLEGYEKDDNNNCYIIRTFNILKYFGFIEFNDKKLEIGKIMTTELFRKYIKIGLYSA
jgi:hypothetical protein